MMNLRFSVGTSSICSLVLAYPSQDAGCQMLNVLHHQKKLKMDLKKQCDYRKRILLAPEEYVGDNKFKVQERVKL